MTMKHLALCLSNNFGDDFCSDDVLPGLVYETLGEEQGSLRIVDELGEDFLYPAKHFLLLTDVQSAQLPQGLLFAAQVDRASQIMNSNLTTTPVQWRDPIVEQLQEPRAQLLEQYFSLTPFYSFLRGRYLDFSTVRIMSAEFPL
jgi:hypothetical protein